MAPVAIAGGGCAWGGDTRLAIQPGRTRGEGVGPGPRRNPANRERVLVLVLDPQALIGVMETSMSVFPRLRCDRPRTSRRSRRRPGGTDPRLPKRGQRPVPRRQRPKGSRGSSPTHSWSSRPGATGSGSSAVTRRATGPGTFSNGGRSSPLSCTSSRRTETDSGGGSRRATSAPGVDPPSDAHAC